MDTKPTNEEVRKAINKTIDDVIKHNLTVLFCGINPGLYSAAVGHNFARPGNRFWPAIYHAGFTRSLLSPSEEMRLLDYGVGITNIVKRATASADELTKEELIQGAGELIRKVQRYKPNYLAVVGLTAYRTAFAAPKAKIGMQENTVGNTSVWVLPNTSGLNAHYQLRDLIQHFRELWLHVDAKKIIPSAED